MRILADVAPYSREYQEYAARTRLSRPSTTALPSRSGRPGSPPFKSPSATSTRRSTQSRERSRAPAPRASS
jgi:hypothetical protein